MPEHYGTAAAPLSIFRNPGLAVAAQRNRRTVLRRLRFFDIRPCAVSVRSFVPATQENCSWLRFDP
jgi:hypothetical protein